jgi:hypothetical protein
MARKKTHVDENSDGTDGQNNGNANTNAQPAADSSKRNPLVYVAIAAVVIVVIAIAYFALAGVGSSSPSSRQIFSNISSAGLNQTQLLFVNDLKKSENVSNLQVSYYSSNATKYITESSNLTIAISSNQTVNSYKMGSYNKTVITSIVAYTDTKNGDVIAKNVSSTYYYNTNTTVTCFNDTTYSSVLAANSSLQCGTGDQGLSYIEQTPFTAVNVSSLSYLAFNNTVTYSGTKTMAGRSCDDFIISNATASNIQSNYSVYDLCIDSQYGIPLYFNQTDVTGGVPSSFTFVATSVSTNVPSSEFVIPQSYLNTIQKSII